MNHPPGNAEPQLGTSTPGADHPAKAWYSRGYLPHCDQMELLQFITFRLADSLPQEKLQQLAEELEIMKRDAELGLSVPRGEVMKEKAEPRRGVPGRQPFNAEAEKRKRIERWLDAGMGCCALRHPQVAQVTEETLLIFDGKKYRLLAWCIMPNHVHVLIEPKVPVWKIVQSWKAYTGRWAMERNAELGLGITGKRFWMRDYWDRYIRDESHFHTMVAYIHDNPVKAKLCASSQNWLWSSATELP